MDTNDSINIYNVYQNSNWYTVGEGSADVYIKIKDASGNVLFTSSRFDDPTFPIVFNIGVHVSTPPYLIEVWDYDPIGSDDLIETFTINTIRGENHTYVPTSSIVDISYTIKSIGRQPFLDAHWGLERTIDFYREKFFRNSYDNKGSIVYQLVNQPSTSVGILGGTYTNACALGELQPCLIIYGMGMISSEIGKKASSTKPLVAIDIVAHEFSHLVTKTNGNGGLIYKGEAGALNESFSDIMGVSVKKYATGSNDWLIGSDHMIYVSNLRSLSNPKNSSDGLEAQPSTYGGLFWVDVNGIKDNGGVHFNSGVQNYWFYLLSEGGSGTNDINYQYNVTGIGIDKAVQIAYRNLIYYLTPEATFYDSRNGSIQSAIDLYGLNSQEHLSTIAAWDAVGVLQEVDSTEERTCSTLPFSEPFSSSQGDFTIENVNLDGLNYVWTTTSNYGMKASAYVSQTNHATESWLISPCLDFPENSTISLTFDHVYRYTSTPTTQLTLMVSEDYISGSPTTATWTQITIPIYSSGTNWTFVNSTPIDLSAYAGKQVAIAFRYMSSSTEAPTWEIKNVSITSTTSPTDMGNTIQSKEKPIKVLENGQMFILLPDGTRYDSAGKRVE